MSDTDDNGFGASKSSAKPRPIKRRLSAIFSADVQGYSRLMEMDEEYTVGTVTFYRNLMAGLVDQYQGRVVDSPGDNLLAEFASVLDAVNCAIEVQLRIRKSNLDKPADHKMLFRIGINLGDVIVEGERIYGEGVNVAARLEGLAEGGGICVSRPVHDQVKKKVSKKFEYLGPKTVKNISEPVRVYRICLDDDHGKAPQQKESHDLSKTTTKISKKSPEKGLRKKPFQDTWPEIGALIRQYKPEAFESALPLLRKKTDEQPADGWAHAMTAYVLWESANQGWLRNLGLGYFESRLQARYHLQAAQEVISPWDEVVRSEIRLLRRDFSGAVTLSRELLEKNPADPISLSWMAQVLIMSGRSMEAVTLIQGAIKNEPQNPGLHLYRLALAYLTMGRIEEALALYEKAGVANPWINLFKAAHGVALFYSGKKEESRNLINQYKAMWPVLPNIRRVMFFWPFQDERAVNFFAEGLIGARLAGTDSDCLYCREPLRLNGPRIRSLFFGKTVSGFDPWTGRQEWVKRDREGKAVLYTGREGQKAIDKGQSRIENNVLCDRWEERTKGIEICGPVYENPRGNSGQKDEFIMFTDYGFFPVSLV